MKQLELNEEEIDTIVEALNYSSSTVELQEKLLKYIGKYIPKRGVIAKEAFVVFEKYASDIKDPLNYKVEINLVEHIKDYDETKVECIRKRQYYHPLKSNVFGTRIEAKLAGYKAVKSILMGSTDGYMKKHKQKVDEKLKKLDRQIYLIEAFPEKWI